MNILGIIPARYGSSRLEGKPLADIGGKPMIQWVYERARAVVPQVVVATDDKRIMDTVHGFGGKAVLTSPHHTSGTNRCLEAYQNYEGPAPDVILNIQGDEPLLEPELLTALVDCFKDSAVSMATLATPVKDQFVLTSDSNVFITLDKHKDALYFSRSPIPHLRGVPKEDWLNQGNFLQHIGLYGFTPKALQEFAAMGESKLEKAEALEQLRWLEDGRKIRVAITGHKGISVDTPTDLEAVRKLVSERKNQ